MANDFCGPQVWPGTVQQLSGLSAYRKVSRALPSIQTFAFNAPGECCNIAAVRRRKAPGDYTSVFRVQTLSASLIEQRLSCVTAFAIHDTQPVIRPALRELPRFGNG